MRYYRHETDIVWLEDIEPYAYVRENTYWCARRRGPPSRALVRKMRARLIGYAELDPKAPNDGPGCFVRRLFYVLPHDRSEDPTGPYRNDAPFEAVDPRTVAPSIGGQWPAATPATQGEEQ